MCTGKLEGGRRRVALRS
uniref:Uncharacterized protein n=1 Tax=Anguilla anguilla TaxID=7936 RepID=A0A0E9PNZ3_ANGAN